MLPFGGHSSYCEFHKAQKNGRRESFELESGTKARNQVGLCNESMHLGGVLV